MNIHAHKCLYIYVCMYRETYISILHSCIPLNSNIKWFVAEILKVCFEFQHQFGVHVCYYRYLVVDIEWVEGNGNGVVAQYKYLVCRKYSRNTAMSTVSASFVNTMLNSTMKKTKVWTDSGLTGSHVRGMGNCVYVKKCINKLC